MSSYTSGGVIVDADDPVANVALAAEIGSIVSIDIPTNVESVPDDSGNIYDEGHAITHFEPIANITSKSIAEILSVIGIGGTCFVGSVGNLGVDIFAKKRGDCLTDVNTTDHTRYRFDSGLLTLGTLQASRGSDATLSFMIDGITDGSNAPIIITHGVALPASLEKAQWELAIGKIAGTVFKPTDLTINFNVQKEKPRPLAPSIWNDRIAVSKVQPTVTVRGIDPSVISASGLDPSGESATHANTLFQLTKRVTGGSYVDAATEVHIGITVAGLVLVTNPFSVSGQSDATVDIEIRCIHDGTNIPILIDTTWAYDSTP